jgi:hypothetical protein
VNLAPLLDADKVQRLEPFGDDTWDLLRVIQESFGIEFTADDLIAANTVGKLGECISKKLTGPPTDRCLGAVVFHRLRRAFVDLYLAPRAKIRPDTGLDELLPWPRRLGQWESLRRQSKLILPDLAYPGWLVGAVLLVSTAGAWTFCGLVSEDSKKRARNSCGTRDACGLDFKLCLSNAACAANRASFSSFLRQHA